LTHSAKEKDVVIEYIKAQEERHKRKSFHEEFRELLIAAGIEFDENYLP